MNKLFSLTGPDSNKTNQEPMEKKLNWKHKGRQVVKTGRLNLGLQQKGYKNH